jgi:fimbrial chaperone protein
MMFWPCSIKSFCKTLCLFALAICCAHPSLAMSVVPALIDMSTSGGKTSQISVVNDGAKPLPVEIIVSRIDLDENGEIKSAPAGDDFLIFPPQAMVAPGATQAFRLQWVGDPQIKKSQSYIFSVNRKRVSAPTFRRGSGHGVMPTHERSF